PRHGARSASWRSTSDTVSSAPAWNRRGSWHGTRYRANASLTPGDQHAEMPTRKDDLHVGTPLWVRTRNSTIAAAPRLTARSADVIVVGAGISGALVAEQLTREGRSVLIVDRRPPVRGSTAASTSMIQHELDVPLTHLRRAIGS